MSILHGRRVVLGVTGGVAAYKAAELASALVQHGVALDVVLSKGANEFIRPLTFQALTRRPVHDDLWAPWTAEAAGHVTLAAEAEALLVAPATANATARLALGLADDLLGAINLSTAAPMVLAPAMEHGMFHHPATQAHLATLRERGATIVGPDQGRLASGATGDGRLAPTEALVGALRWRLGRGGPLAGRSVVVTAGGTREAIDPVRYVGNRSSGRMGYALAQAALDAGAAVHLVTGPTDLSPPWGATVSRVESAAEMHAATEAAAHAADLLVMAAAVADFRPATPSAHKIKKRASGDAPSIDLERTTDILAAIGVPGLVKVGFAAETERLVEHATAKLREKGLAMIVANDAATAIGAPDNAVTVITPGGDPEPLPVMPKTRLADELIRRVAALLPPRRVPAPSSHE